MGYWHHHDCVAMAWRTRLLPNDNIAIVVFIHCNGAYVLYNNGFALGPTEAFRLGHDFIPPRTSTILAFE
jgi:hypothetical protein